MRIVAVSDVHGNLSALRALAEAMAGADVVVLSGDLTQFGHAPEAARILDEARAHAPRVFAVAGNCDYPDVADYLEAEGVSLHGRSVVLDGVAFLGAGGSLPCPGRTPNELSEGALARALDAAAEGLNPDLPWVLVTHQPPRETIADRVHGGAHVGSRAVRAFIERHRPAVCFTGHIHEGRGVDSIGPTKVVNPGPARGGYALAELGGAVTLVEIKSAPGTG